MPIYEYRCAKCGKTFEKLQRFSDEPLKVHEECGGEVEKLISQSAFQLKGSGWYVTDYAKGSATAPPAKSDGTAAESKSEAKTDSKGDSKSDSKGESKSDSKSESKTETKTESKPAVSTNGKND
jgi:putative FmdB family regulatory protein